MINESLLTKKQVASRLQISVRTVESLMARGLLAYVRISYRIVRFRPTAIEEYVDRCTIGGVDIIEG